MKKIGLLLIVLMSFSCVFSQSKSTLTSQLGLSFTDYAQCKAVNIPYISIGYRYRIIKNIQMGVKINTGNINKFKDNFGTNSYNFTDGILTVNYSKTLFNKLLLEIGNDFGIEGFFSSEVVEKKDFFPEKNDIFLIMSFIAPFANIDYIFKNNLFIGLSYSHKIFFKDKNASNILLNIGVRL